MDDMDMSRFRTTGGEVNPLFVRRWSPRAMSGETVSRAEMMSLFEAARWAPSSNNNQPWRFVFAMRDDPAWATFFDLLTPGNKLWCVNAAALVVVVSRNTFDSGSLSRTHSYDTGAAWVSLALQGTIMGLVVHGMQGFDYDRAASELAIPEGFTVEAMIAIGRHGRIEDLAEEKRPQEFPRDRHPVGEFVFHGRFGEKIIETSD